MNVCAADLHVHTALSPCAENDMTPPAIVDRALAEGLGMIAVCDHNSTRNTAAVQEAAGARLTVLAGMEITTVEECHIVALFPDAAAAQAAGAEVGATLGQVDDGYETFFGEQRVLAADGGERARETLALATATTLDLEAAVALVHDHGGLAIAAHIDRRSFGVIGQLGLFPSDAGFDAVELSRHVAAGSPDEATFVVHGLPLVHSSDAHYQSDIGAARTVVHCERPTFAELALALAGARGRSVGDA
ncbi:MAG: PHP domain-containing protein [Actinomycetes bacterium]